MRSVVRFVIFATLVWIGLVMYWEAQAQGRLENPDHSKVMMLFGGMILDGLVLALVFALAVLPMIGETIGAFFYSPATEIEHDPHAGAIAKLAQGDPEGAIEEYEEILAQDPSDTLALSEIARICCRDLEDTARGGAVLETALQKEWPEEQASFLGNRLVDVYMQQGDTERSMAVLRTLTETLAGTKFAANALHRLHEIERGQAPGGVLPAGETDES